MRNREIKRGMSRGKGGGKGGKRKGGKRTAAVEEGGRSRHDTILAESFRGC